jgi:hypothetical protein
MKRFMIMASLISILLQQALASSAIAMGRFNEEGGVPEIDVGIARSGIILLVAALLILKGHRHGH